MERTEAGLATYPRALQGLTTEQATLFSGNRDFGGYQTVLLGIEGWYAALEKEGIWPEGATKAEILEAADKNPQIIDAYTKVRRSGRGFYPRPYNDIKPYSEMLPQIASEIKKVAKWARDNRVYQAYFIEQSLIPQAQALIDCDFQRARIHHLNIDQLPELEMVTGLIDRYPDRLLGVKFVPQGWVIKRNNVLTGTYNEIIQAVTGSMGRREGAPRHRVIAGDAIAFAGLAARKPWSGNTLPSEDSLRRNVGSLSYVFVNVLDEKFEGALKPAIEKYTPFVTEIDGWEEKAKRAARINLILHEGWGHSYVRFDADTESDLQEDYMALKELMCEVAAQDGVFRVPPRLLNRDMKLIVIGNSFAWSRDDIDEYNKKALDDPDRQPLEAYARAWEMMNNWYERRRCIRVNPDNGCIMIEDFDSFAECNRQFGYALLEYVQSEGEQEGSIEAFIRLNSTHPRTYIINGSDSNSSSKVLAS